jgi:hypothetical protein
MLSNFAKFASHLLDLDLAFLRVPARTLTFAPTIAHPVLVPNTDNNRSILTYIDGLCQLQKDLTLPADLSAHVRAVVDLRRNIADRMQRLQAYINAEFNRQYHNGASTLLSCFLVLLNSSTRAAVLDWTGTIYPAICVSGAGESKSSRWRYVPFFLYFDCLLTFS